MRNKKRAEEGGVGGKKEVGESEMGKRRRINRCMKVLVDAANDMIDDGSKPFMPSSVNSSL